MTDSTHQTATATSNAFSKQVVDALGLTGRIYNIKIEAPVNRMVTITTSQYVTVEQAQKLASIIKEYELHEKPTDAPKA